MSELITPFLWFDTDAEAAAEFYTAVFPDSELVNRMPGPDGSVMGVAFRLHGQEFIAFNGGPELHFNEAVSFFVSCADQQEVDRYWAKLSEGGEESRCGWLKDKYGLSWQIVPSEMGELLGDPDPEKATRVRDAMLQMTKIDLKELREAYEGVGAETR